MTRKNYSLFIRNVAYCLLFAAFGLLSDSAFSQGAAINSTGAAADPSAMLDVSSSTKGTLITRMTTSDRDAIPSPADGLLIYNTTTNCFEAYVLNAWKSVSCPANCYAPNAPGMITGDIITCNNSSVSYSISQVNSATTYNWKAPAGWSITGGQGTTGITVTTGALNQNGDISVTADNSCGAGPASTLAVSVTGTPVSAGTITGATTVCQGQNFVTYTVPAITYATSYVWALPTGATGSSTSNSIAVDYSTSAVSGDIIVKGINTPCGDGPTSSLAVTVDLLPASAGTITGATTACPGSTSVIYTVPAIANATSYLWYLPSGATGISTTNSISVDYSLSAVSGSITVKGQNSCGDGIAASLSITIVSCFCGNVSFTYNGSSLTYGTFEGYNSTCWLDRNLGASQVATAYNDAQAYGDLFQWGRLDDGHQLRNSSTTSTLSNTDVPGHAKYITAVGGFWDWRSPQNDNLWQGLSGINNPCPPGWRIPTSTELDSERASWSQQNYNGAFAGSLKFTTAGYRTHAGALSEANIYGNYWSSTLLSNQGIFLRFFSSNAWMTGYERVYGLSVRCIKD